MAAEFLERMGARLRERREELGLSRAEVARRMPGKVNENQVYRWENGKHQPNPDTLEALAKILERDVSYFLTPRSRATAPTVDTQVPDPVLLRLDRIEALLTEIVSENPESISSRLADLCVRVDQVMVARAAAVALDAGALRQSEASPAPIRKSRRQQR